VKFLSHFGHYKLLVAATVAALVTATSVFGSGVLAEGGPDGTIQEEGDAELVVQTNCGSVLNSVVKTDNFGASVNLFAGFVNIPNAFATVVIPAFQTDCIKAVYTVEAAASGVGTNFCYVRALVNGIAMNPVSNDRVLASEDTTAEAATYEWIARRTAGFANTAFTVQMQWAGTAGGSTCWRDDSTLDVERLN